MTSALNLTFPVISHQPSSLSLNDVENLEKECLGASKRSSMEYSARGDDEEPEALIVEVEDIVEETAAPLVENYLAKRQTPVYQHEAIKSMWYDATLGRNRVPSRFVSAPAKPAWLPK